MRETTMMKLPALAVVGPDRRIVRSTESFLRRHEDAEKMCESSPELEQVLTGQADAATVNVGELSIAIEAVIDAAGRRQAMLTLPPVHPSPPPEPPLDALRDAADASPAVVWVKDLTGRSLYANPRYAEDLGVSEDGIDEPLQVEYTVPGVGGRPALAAFRFALRDARGMPVATCGVAAPVDEAEVARAQAVRLMQLERWNRLDPVEVRAELLEQWRVQAVAPRTTTAESVSRPTEVPAAPTPAPPPTQAPARAPVAPTLTDTAELLQVELQQAQVRIRQAESDAQQAQAAAARAVEEADRYRCELEQVRLELERARAETEAAAALRLSEELRRAVAAERERGDELERKLASLGPRLTDFETVLDGAPARRS